jgi:hypothetical protein
LADGALLLHGFRNRDVRAVLYGDSDDPVERRKQGAAITRLLALLRAHGLIVKVPKSHRYNLSAASKRIVTALLAAHAADSARLTDYELLIDALRGAHVVHADVLGPHFDGNLIVDDFAAFDAGAHVELR